MIVSDTLRDLQQLKPSILISLESSLEQASHQRLHVLLRLLIDQIKRLLGQGHVVASVSVMMLEHDLYDVVDLDIHAVVDYRLKQLKRVGVVLVGIVAHLLLKLIVVLVIILVCR